MHVMTAMPNYPRGRIYPGYGGLFRRETRRDVSVVRSYIYPTISIGKVRRITHHMSFVFSSIAVGTFALPKLDYLITESPPLFLGMAGYFLSKAKRARWIFNVSDLWPESAVRLGVLGEGRSLRIAKSLEAFCYRKAWMVTGQSKEILENIQDRFPSVSTYHLSNGVDTNLFSPHEMTPQAREELAKGQKYVAVYAGLHGLAQGLEQLLEAASRLQDLEELSIVFVGDGPEKKSLMARAEELGLANVRFLDPYPLDSMPGIMASADIALVPLKNRLPGAVPSKIYEAMGVGVPVVLVADGEAVQILHDSQAGIAVSPGDIPGLVAAIRGLIKDPSVRRQMGERGRSAAMTRFNRDSIADELAERLEAGL